VHGIVRIRVVVVEHASVTTQNKTNVHKTGRNTRYGRLSYLGESRCDFVVLEEFLDRYRTVYQNFEQNRARDSPVDILLRTPQKNRQHLLSAAIDEQW